MDFDIDYVETIFEFSYGWNFSELSYCSKVFKLELQLSCDASYF